MRGQTSLAPTRHCARGHATGVVAVGSPVVGAGVETGGVGVPAMVEVVVMGDKLRVAPAELADSIQVRLQRMYPGSRYLAQGNAVIVPLPSEPSDSQLIAWTDGLLVAIFGAEVGAAVVE